MIRFWFEINSAFFRFFNWIKHLVCFMRAALRQLAINEDWSFIALTLFPISLIESNTFAPFIIVHMRLEIITSRVKSCATWFKLDLKIKVQFKSKVLSFQCDASELHHKSLRSFVAKNTRGWLGDIIATPFWMKTSHSKKC